jgi:hypothetical protein
MTEIRRLEAKPEVTFYAEPDERPLWLRHHIKNRHHYLNVVILNCKDLDRYDEGIQYLAELTEALFNSPVVSQATFYDDNYGSGEAAKEMYDKLEAYKSRIARTPRERSKLDWMIYLRFTAVDYEAVQQELQAHIDATFESMPIPDFIEKVNSILYIENHVMVRHEDYDVLSTAAGIGVEGDPGTNKCATYGFSKPSRDPYDPKMQVAYIDWYQEVRQHDSMRANFPDEVGRMWLQISSEKPFDYWCLTTYEYCASDMNLIKKTIGAAYYAMNAYRGDTGDLYHPYYEGGCLVIAEYMKPY